jgi:LysM repeat protein
LKKTFETERTSARFAIRMKVLKPLYLFSGHLSKACYSALWLLAFCGFLSQGAAFAQTSGHTIKKGETLGAIARKYKTTVTELLRLNPGAEKGISAGAELNLPATGKSKNHEALKSEKEKKSEPKEGKKHIVKAGESLYKIAGRYKVSVADLEKWNGITNKELKSGTEIFVSEQGEEKEMSQKQSETRQNNEAEAEKTILHKVTGGETLSRIAKKYGMDVKKLKEINGLKSNQLSLGQELKVSPTQVQENQEEKKPEKKEEPEQSLRNEKGKPERLEEKIKAAEPVKAAETAAQTNDKPSAAVSTEAPKPEENPITREEPKPSAGSIREVNNTLGYTRIIETGFAEAIEGDQSSKKHLCMHKSAPIGSILQVKNEANGQTVFVKVIGRLPETGTNEKLIIRISRVAYEKLMATGKRFPVEVSYPESQP